MNLALEREKLIEQLNNIEDIHLIKAIKEMLAYAQTTSRRNVASLSDEEISIRLNKSEDDIKNGRVISLADVRAKYK